MSVRTNGLGLGRVHRFGLKLVRLVIGSGQLVRISRHMFISDLVNIGSRSYRVGWVVSGFSRVVTGSGYRLGPVIVRVIK